MGVRTQRARIRAGEACAGAVGLGDARSRETGAGMGENVKKPTAPRVLNLDFSVA